MTAIFLVLWVFYGFMVPHEFVYRKKLPKTKLGKVDFKKLESDIGKDEE